MVWVGMFANEASVTTIEAIRRTVGVVAETVSL